MARARRYKHVLGAAMRQAGIAAAGCLYALDHHVDRLADDHAHAEKLASGLAELGCHVDPVETNMAFFDPPGEVPAFLAGLAEHGVRMGAVAGRVRAVTHLDVDDAGIDAALTAARSVLRDCIGRRETRRSSSRPSPAAPPASWPARRGCARPAWPPAGRCRPAPRGPRSGRRRWCR